ncbi:MAG: hypothetical protein DMG57_26465 [Acidobacteria bacterium]|nr:MAG: hypothetical protein DMG57_26465 [Acidobacteriota bacterium]
MHPKRLSPLSAAARMMGKKGGKRTLELYGAELFSKASKARKVFGGGWPKRKAKEAVGQEENRRKEIIDKRGGRWHLDVLSTEFGTGKHWTPPTSVRH